MALSPYPVIQFDKSIAVQQLPVNMSFIHLLFPPEETQALRDTSRQPSSRKRKIAADEMQAEVSIHAAKSRRRHDFQKEIMSEFTKQMTRWGIREVVAQESRTSHDGMDTIDPCHLHRLSSDSWDLDLNADQWLEESSPGTDVSKSTSASPSSTTSSIESSWSSQSPGPFSCFLDHWRITSQELQLIEELVEPSQMDFPETPHRSPSIEAAGENGTTDQLRPALDSEESHNGPGKSQRIGVSDLMNDFTTQDPISPDLGPTDSDNEDRLPSS